MHRIEVVSDLNTIDANQWNALLSDKQPFCQHQFLANLEKHHCVGKNFGWLPKHLLAYEGDHLLGALILYQKNNSYGEFVFDHSWAQAYHHYQIPYFPKLVSAIPYTPIRSAQFLSQHKDKKTIFQQLLNAAIELTEKIKASGLHILLVNDEQKTFLNQQSLLMRHDCQFHWHNQNYPSFDDFLNTLSSKKRKNIRRERQKVKTQQLEIRLLNGLEATKQDWFVFNQLYEKTFHERNSPPTLNASFFQAVAEAMPTQILLVMAYQKEQVIAAALMFHDKTTLYGRHWGASHYVDFLHFELCYYQGIEFCIKQQLKHFEPGAQGEHKLSRGFLPQTTYSAHYLRETPLKKAIENFCLDEKKMVENYITTLKAHSPYRQKN